ncbi:MAG: PBP1A family penicillin-binding protein [Candidatus Alcyoniella australis]|nr:PBP1A family penicillin-binding protein [Candidatus Alcyoniella australis]
MATRKPRITMPRGTSEAPKRKTSGGARKAGPTSLGGGRRTSGTTSRTRKPTGKPRRKPARKPGSGASRTRLLLRLARQLLLLGAALLVMFAIGCALYGYGLRDEVRERFTATQRWQVPSRIYSDSLTIVPGSNVEALALDSRLSRLGYTTIASRPTRKGQFRNTDQFYEIFVHDFDYPHEKRPGFLLRLELRNGNVVGLRDLSADSEIYSAELEPEQISAFSGPHREDREVVRLDQISPYLINAVIAVEDHRFYKHYGISPLSLARAMLANLRAGRVVQGGSTITQQLVKNFYLDDPSRTYSRKLKEAIIAVVLETQISKEEILELYLNEVYFGQIGPAAICGVGEASRFYFGKSVSNLDLAESALLAGLVRSPGIYNPRTNLERAEVRRDFILERMLDQGLITPEESQRSTGSQLELRSQRPPLRFAPYFIDLLRSQLAQYYSEQVLIGEGLRVFTTLDAQMQRNAEQAVRFGIERLEGQFPNIKDYTDNPLQIALVVIEPATGSIRALIGGRHYGRSQFNRATQARRQAGSSFKPIAYLAAFDRAWRDPQFEFTAATLLDDEKFTIDQAGSPPYTPRNYDGKKHGEVTVRTALEHSYNIAAVRVGQMVGFDRVTAMARAMGINSELSPTPSIVLGAYEVTVLEMASAYSVLANEGYRASPISVRAVLNAHGEELRHKDFEIEKITAPQNAYLLTNILRGVLLRGTGRSAPVYGLRHTAAGKTGTTNGYRDAWFIGYTPRLLCAVWVGFDQKNPGDNRKYPRLTGAGAALPIWSKFMALQLAGTPDEDFRRPADIVEVKIDRANGLVANEDTEDFIYEAFISGTQPLEESPLNRNPLLELFRGLQQEEQ